MAIELRKDPLPDGDGGQHLGFDANGFAYILHWNRGGARQEAGWVCIGLEPVLVDGRFEGNQRPIAHNHIRHIVSWARV